MRKNIFLTVALLTAFAFTSKSQVQLMNCSSFCVLNITIDTTNNRLNVTIYNGDTNQVNYPTVRVVDITGDTIGNKTDYFYLFAQLPGDTIVHEIPTSLDSLPSGFAGTVYLTDRTYDTTCAFSYPMNCTVGIKEKQHLESSISIYPNPASNIININVAELNNKQAIINLYDNLGRLIKTYTCSNKQLTINREGLLNGIYFVTVEFDNKRLSSKLILK